MDPLTILLGVGFAGAKHFGANEVISDILGHLTGHAAHGEVGRAREKLNHWLKGPHPDKNMDLEKAVALSALEADLFCLQEARRWTRLTDFEDQLCAAEDERKARIKALDD